MKTFKRYGVSWAYAKGAIVCLDPVYMDIETSNNHADKPEKLRTWITSIQVIFRNKYYFFRYPEELIKFYQDLYTKLHLEPDLKFKRKLITYVHNLSYEMSYLFPYFQELPTFGELYTGIVESPNKFLTYVRGSLEFRCSYRLSGMSLEKWSNEMNIEHKKQVGLYDYEAVIYQDQKINNADSLKYDLYDVLSMQECLKKTLSYHHDDLTTIPLTSTGYIRRTLRRSCRNDKKYRNKYFWKNRLDPVLFDYCVRSYAGGYTHNNRWYNDLLIKTGGTYTYGDKNKIQVKVDRMRHGDFKSHYPTQMTCYPMPLGRPQQVYTQEMGMSLSFRRILEWYPEYTTICKVHFTKAELKDENISMPFMQDSKCYNCHIKHKRVDNGRILKIEGSFDMYLDNLTIDILVHQYKMKYKIIDCWRMKNEKLPDCIINVIDKYFKGKSDHKNIVKELTKQYGKLNNRTINEEFELMQQKKGLNSIYGCTATNPLKIELYCDDNMNFPVRKNYITYDEVEQGLNDYYKKYNSFLPYQIAGMITSYARHELAEYIGVFDTKKNKKGIGYENCLYCDTDSIFYISTPEIEKRIEKLNAEKHKKAHFVTLENGKQEYYDVFDFEPDIKAFKGLHAKCYGTVTDKGLEITIAGVPSRTLVDMVNNEPVYITREMEMSIKDYDAEKAKKIMSSKDKIKTLNDMLITDPFEALNNLTDEFAFYINTGISALYIGATGFKTDRKPQIIEIDGHKIHTAGGCVLRKLDKKIVTNYGIEETNDPNCETIENMDFLK